MGAAVGICGLLVVAPAGFGALTSVTPRTALTQDHVGLQTAAALPDGRVLVGLIDNSSSGNTMQAVVRPAVGVLPATAQLLQGGTPGESLTFLPGGPADDPVLADWLDGGACAPFRTRLEGDTFTGPTNVLHGVYSTGRFPRFARCADGTTVFAFQYTNISPPSPTTFSTIASRATSAGARDGTTFAGSQTPDSAQDPTVACDRNTGLFSSAVAGDSQSGSVMPKQLRAIDVTNGVTLLNQPTFAAHAFAGAPDVRIAPNGRLWLKWTEQPVNPSGPPTTYLGTRAPGATGPVAVSSTPFLTGVFPGDFFFDAAGNTHVLIAHDVPAGTSFGIRTAPAGSATFGAEQELLPPANHSAKLLLDHPDGNPRLLVTTVDTSVSPAVSRYSLQGIPQAGSGSATTRIDFDGLQFPTATFLPTGDLFIAGVKPGATASDPQSLVEGGLDTGAPPTIDAVDVPGLAAAGESTSISLLAKDPLGLSSFAWSVSGGPLTSPITLGTQQASIPPLQPGTYTVLGRAVDRAGNATQISRTLRVLDPAAVTPGSQAFADAVAKAGGTLDRTPPVLSKLAGRTGKRGKAKRTVSVSFGVSEPAAADVELLGTVKRSGQRGTLVLKSGRLASVSAGKGGTLKLLIPSSLAKLVGSKLSVRVTLTDLAGNRTQQTVAVKATTTAKTKSAKH